MSWIKLNGLLGAITIVALAGCQRAAPTATPASATTAAGAKYLLAAEPEGAHPVIEAREAAQDQEDIVVLGRIGGDINPWIEGLAAFSIVDPSLKACSDIEGDGCPTPWDYCCETDKLPAAKVLVKVVDESGRSVDTDARKLLGVKELQTVVVKGKAHRDEAGNLTVLASGIYVRPADGHDHAHEGHDHGHADGHKHDHDHDHDHPKGTKDHHDEK
jgi:ABC-type nickel/cobalt efflux system permease component RcnA